MRKLAGIQATALSLMFCGAAQAQDAVLPEGVDQLAVRAAEVVWQPCPPNLPEGCEIAVLEGNPQGPGLFTVRFRIGADFAMPPHTHPLEERVTVLEGVVAVAFGEETARADGAEFGPGDYYVNARERVHSVWAEQGTVIQITGLGPWEAHFVD